VIALTARRRAEVGLYLSFVFEKRALLPGPRELSATVFIGIAENFMGIDTCASRSRPGPRAFRDSPVDLVVDHPAARARARLSQEAWAGLLTDLAS
jgi:hypothetical protein